MEIKCSMCSAKSELINDKHLPYRWSEVHRETADCHDSESVSWKSDFYLCPDCIGVVLGHVEIGFNIVHCCDDEIKMTKDGHTVTYVMKKEGHTELKAAEAMMTALEKIIPPNKAHRDYSETVQLKIEQLLNELDEMKSILKVRSKVEITALIEKYGDPQYKVNEFAMYDLIGACQQLMAELGEMKKVVGLTDKLCPIGHTNTCGYWAKQQKQIDNFQFKLESTERSLTRRNNIIMEIYNLTKPATWCGCQTVHELVANILGLSK